VAYRKSGSVAYTSVAYIPIHHCCEIHPRRTRLYATDTEHTRGVQTCTPLVGELAVAYRLYATGSPVPVASYPWRTAVRQYATDRQILYATDEVFPSSVHPTKFIS
jgi:hypothetical protein